MTYKKYTVNFTNDFKKEYKKIKKQGKDLSKLFTIVENLASGKELSPEYKDHKLNNNKRLKNAGNVI